MITIVDYGAGNIASVSNMIRKVGGTSISTNSADLLSSADKILLPGVGAFDYGMDRLTGLGLVEVLKERAASGVPILGICLGMQLLSRGSDEGQLPGLGLVPARFHKFKAEREHGLRVPHIGWNTVEICQENKLIRQSSEEQRFYFVHSYYGICESESNVLCRTHYGSSFVSAYSVGNVYGCQFHPEKSHKFGMELMLRFLEI